MSNLLYMMRSEKRQLCAAFEPFMDEDLGRKASREMYISRGGDPTEPETDLTRYMGMLHYLTLCQYARRIFFYDPILFANSLDKVSFRDMVLSEDFSIEDAARFTLLFGQVDGFPLPWMKDSFYEALEMMKRAKKGPPEHAAANLGKVGTPLLTPRTRFFDLKGMSRSSVQDSRRLDLQSNACGPHL